MSLLHAEYGIKTEFFFTLFDQKTVQIQHIPECKKAHDDQPDKEHHHRRIAVAHIGNTF
ncbi:hypothetical protein SDC9_192110 [bioreactor metagenome]|uniref:Uncharacterized protein n=1 Tax=bioreactor metagenome TaxID=1076179 RepID=A0A645HZS1_9ZZZZ